MKAVSKNRPKGTVTGAILKSFIPYSKENLMLTYKPNSFFNYLDKLERETGASRNTLHVTISRAKRAGLLRVDKQGQLVTTWRGKLKLKLRPQGKLRHNLIIIFDIPENQRHNRDTLRSYLRSTYCEQVQKSVWKTKFDIHDELLEVINDLDISPYVTVFVADEVPSSTFKP